MSADPRSLPQKSRVAPAINRDGAAATLRFNLADTIVGALTAANIKALVAGSAHLTGPAGTHRLLLNVLCETFGGRECTTISDITRGSLCPGSWS